MESAFSRLAPFVREYVYEKKWTALRRIQEAAIAEILDGDQHLIIAAGTASGKTEACFFPVISLLSERRPRSVGALCISPLKALINDQAERLAPLMERAELPLWRWHGDVSAGHKKRLLENPSGVLQISPESLEALLLRSPGMVRSLFGDLSFVVIDEVHVFTGSDRGSQILCQLARIEEAALCRPRRIGLSATLGDYTGALEWIALGSGRNRTGGSPGVVASNTALVQEAEAGDHRRVSILLDHFARAKGEGRAFREALYRQVRGRRCIIFTNSRLEAEDTIAGLREISAGRRGEDRFFIHHGSVAASLRAETERELRDSPGPLIAAATASLEMGIDIGSLDRVAQIGPPLSVSAFVQRLGRSGRLRGKPEIYFSSLEEARPGARGLPWGLVKTIAVIELYVKEKWIEQDFQAPLPYSLLVHQTLSILVSLGEHSPVSLARRVLSLPPFARIDEDDFKKILNCLIAADIVERTPEANLITGLGAERFTGHYSFYSVFAGDFEYRVLAGGREIGRVNYLPPEGSSIVLGGRYWQVENIRRREREIAVIPGEAGSARVWRGSGAELHPAVARRMRQVLCESTRYPYLSERARIRLGEARETAKKLGLGERIFIPDEEAENTPPGPGAGQDRNRAASFAIFPWLGSRGMRTLLLVLQNRDYRKALGIRSLSRENDFCAGVVSSLPLPLFQAELKEIVRGLRSALPLAVPDEIPLNGKFDPCLPPDLLKKQYAFNMLDPEELREILWDCCASRIKPPKTAE
ncbi:MAG: DEAD/DEAH box helicase [Treponema sp.]|jgi:ATP-dependent Lhr-like helicase|nr:DEAD/DEAH box helicase [Treponema sp.]